MKLTWTAKIITFLALLTTPLSMRALQTDQPDRPRYRLQISLFDGDQLVGQPTVTVAEAMPATVSVAREGGYFIHLIATRAEGRSQSGSVRLAAEVFFLERNSWRQVAAPRLTLALGTTDTVESRPRGTPSRAFRMKVHATEASSSNLSAQYQPGAGGLYAASTR